MYKLIIIDLDGTLLNDKKELNKEDVIMINRAFKEKGVISVIATGRTYMCAKYIAEKVGEGLSQYIIASNGAVIKDNVNNIFLNKQSISSEDTLKILEYCDLNKLRHSIDINSIVIGNERLVNQEKLKDMGEIYKIEKDLLKYFKNNKQESISLTVIGEEDKLLKLRDEFKTYPNIEITNLCKSLDFKDNIKQEVTYVDIMCKNATKKNAIKMLSNYLCIKQSEIIAIGDGGNDIPMFEVSGLKIAMQNSIDIVKEKADYITSNNNNSGVAKAIKKYIFNENI